LCGLWATLTAEIENDRGSHLPGRSRTSRLGWFEKPGQDGERRSVSLLPDDSHFADGEKCSISKFLNFHLGNLPHTKVNRSESYQTFHFPRRNKILPDGPTLLELWCSLFAKALILIFDWMNLFSLASCLIPAGLSPVPLSIFCRDNGKLTSSRFEHSRRSTCYRFVKLAQGPLCFVSLVSTSFAGRFAGARPRFPLTS
jgi:hypothetical protein